MKLQIMKSSVAEKIVENIHITKKKPSTSEQEKLEVILSEHFFLSQLVHLER